MDEKSSYVKVNFGHAQLGDFVEEVAMDDGRVLTEFEPAAGLVGTEIIDGKCDPNVRRNSYWVVYRNTTVGDPNEMKELLRRVVVEIDGDDVKHLDSQLSSALEAELMVWYSKTFDR